MGCCDYCLYRVFGKNPESVVNKDGYLLGRDRVLYNPENESSLPYAVQVTYKPISLRRDPKYPGTKLRYVVPVGTFLKPLEKAFFWHQDVKITFFRVEFKPPDKSDTLVSGWLLDYSPGAGTKVLRAVRSRQPMSVAELGALNSAGADDEIPEGQWYKGNPRPECLPNKIRIIGKTLAVRESPEYPGNKLLFGFDVGNVLRPLEHKLFTYQTGHGKVFATTKENTVINFYRVEFNDRQQGWLLDYSPGDSKRTLEIIYF